jgi:hypothetical protein
METSERGSQVGKQSGAHNEFDSPTDSASKRSSVSDANQAPQSPAPAALSLTDDVKDVAETTARAVKQQASQFASDVGHELSKTAEVQKARGAEAINGFARAISSAASELESQSPKVARSVRDAAAKVGGLSRSLSNHNVDQLFKAASDMAREQPMFFIGGAVAAGFALSRFLKSSGHNSHNATSRPVAGRAVITPAE